MKRIGLSLSKESVAAVVARNTEIVWARLWPRHKVVRDDFARLRGEMPDGVRTMSVALFADTCETRVLNDLPDVSGRQLQRLLNVNGRRWFLRQGTELMIVGRWQKGGDTAIASAVSRAFVEDIADSARRAGFRLRSVAPALCLLAPILKNGRYRLGTEAAYGVEVKAGAIQAIRHGSVVTNWPVPPALPHWDQTTPGDMLSMAYWAATQRARVAFRIRQPREGDALGVAARLTVVGGLLLWIASPAVLMLRATNTAAVIEHRMSMMQSSLTAALKVQVEVDEANEIVRILEDRRRMQSDDLRLISILSATLPRDAKLTSLHRNADGAVTVEGVAPSALEVVAVLDAVDLISQSRLIGSVRRELDRDTVRERFTIRFNWRRGMP